MAAPITGDSILAVPPSDPHPNQTDMKTPNSAQDDNLTLAKIVKTSHSQPIAPSSGKRRKSKPVRFDISGNDAQKMQSLPAIDTQVLSNPSGTYVSVQKENTPTKGLKTPHPSSPAMIRAMELQRSIGSEFPSCIKMMVKSQVSCGFWMGLPLHFCKSFLPKEDVTFVLEDENGGRCEVKYIAYKFGLSAGWKHFAVRHNLIEGDCLVFHLVENAKFKVYIIKANASNEVDGAPSLLNLDSHADRSTPVTPSPKTKKNKRPESLSLTVVQKKHKKSTQSSRSAPPRQIIEHSGNDSEEVGSEILELEGSRPIVSFQEVKAFEDFHIMVKGLCIDRELPEDVRRGYYNLCSYKKEFLHDSVSESTYYKLVAGMIGQTVSIANEIKNCNLTTTKAKFEKWDKSLLSFELWGLKVGFLREQIRALANIVSKSEGASDVKKYLEAKTEHKQLEDEIVKVSAKLKALKESCKKMEGVSCYWEQKAEKYENEFKEEVKAHAPW